MRALVMWCCIILGIVWVLNQAKFVMVNSQFSADARAEAMSEHMGDQ